MAGRAQGANKTRLLHGVESGKNIAFEYAFTQRSVGQQSNLGSQKRAVNHKVNLPADVFDHLLVIAAEDFYADAAGRQCSQGGSG